MAEERRRIADDVKSEESNMENDGGSSFVMDDDAMIEILLLLPAKSLGRFKCVCKKWYNFIQNPNFITNHLHHSKNHNRLFVTHSRSMDDDLSFSLFLDESLSVRRNIKHPLISNGCRFTDIVSIFGPVNGLYCIHYDYFDRHSDIEVDVERFVALWNPCTSGFRQLNFPSIKFPSHLTPRHQFGFGSADDDIKLVCISSFVWYNKKNNANFDSVISLYSLAHDCWRQIEYDTDLSHRYIRKTSAFTYLNGAYYWLVSSYHVIIFDMRTEIFREVPLPAENLLYIDKNSGKKSELDRILVRNHSIVLFVKDYRSQVIDCVHIWEMKEEGCWNKLFCFAPLFFYKEPLGFWKDEEILFRAEYDELYLYNIRSNVSRNLGVEEYYSVRDYKESLTSVKGGRQIDSIPLEL